MNLDDQKVYQALDSGQVAESIESLPRQMKQVLEQVNLIKVPEELSQITQVVVNGMGGSNIGACLVQAALSDRLKVPITITPGYEVPALVQKNTLYLLSSYSGNTEEPLSVYGEVKQRGAKILAIGSDGNNQLTRLREKNNLPGYAFEPKHNPSGQPRLGLGYSVFGIAMLLYKAGLVEIRKSEVKNIIANLEVWTENLKTAKPAKANLAKQLAFKLYEKIPVIIGAEFIAGNLNILRNQFNETSKNFSSFLVLPDLNHYALEGLAHPKSNQENLVFFFVDSSFYHPRVQKRSALTKVILKKNKIAYVEHQLLGNSKLEQAFEMLQLGSWVAYYLAMLNQVNPVEIKRVDWLKQQLG